MIWKNSESLDINLNVQIVIKRFAQVEKVLIATTIVDESVLKLL